VASLHPVLSRRATLKTAKALGLAVSAKLLVIADGVIE
jgi:hypothetical protein